MAAKTLLMRPQMIALCASRAHLFSSLALPYCSLLTKPYNYVIPRNLLLSQSNCGTKLLGGGTKSEGGGPAAVGRRRSISIRATTDVNDSSQIDSPLMASMEKKIKEHLNAESVSVKDAYGDGRHVSIDVISSAFEGQSAVNRQRMVYKAIWEELQNTVHAVDQMTTKTPTEAEGK
ncbi:protein BOLA4, chloroplastic/mitochondrial [Cornus florida]|uniref:protein BOLA4, chloroplastic/mitochondrial n=1 Tax=Cornus florida TaxID=4283 RepID=UPI002899F3FA|nr:protein BOLA4, chloroplastic/mitochondrial [Cornus florida]